MVIVVPSFLSRLPSFLYYAASQDYNSNPTLWCKCLSFFHWNAFGTNTRMIRRSRAGMEEAQFIFL